MGKIFVGLWFRGVVVGCTEVRSVERCSYTDVKCLYELLEVFHSHVWVRYSRQEASKASGSSNLLIGKLDRKH